MPYDLRNFIYDLKKAGELIEVDKEVDWNYEISAFEVMSARVGGPAFLFNNIKGIPGGRVLLGHFAGTLCRPHRRIARALGMNPDADWFTFVQNLVPKMSNALRPVEVATGPCKEVIKMGMDVNLLEFPFTYHAIGDGGRYILLNTVIIKDPDSDWINTGDYAIEVYSRNRLVLTPYAHSNWVMIYTTKYEARNQSMPIAIALGGDPAITLAAGAIMPAGISEFDIAGGLRGIPIELVRAETSDILVPADAEIVIEGEVRPYERLLEGPKIEAFGFSVGPRQPFYAMRVHCITHRKNPILYDIHCSLGAGTHAIHEVLMPLGAYMMTKATKMPLKMGMGALPFRTGSTAIFSVKKRAYPGFMHDLFNQTLGNPMAAVFPSQLYVDDDVNIFELSDVWEAQYTQVNPARDIRITERAYPTMTISSSWMEEEDWAKYFRGGTLSYSKMLADATTKEEPPQGVRRTCFETLFPKELQKWVVDNWQRLGFTEEVRWNEPWIEAEL